MIVTLSTVIFGSDGPELYMKQIIRLGLLFLGLQAFHSLDAQLLVVKKANNRFAPLDADDERNKAAIAKLFTNYQWPMVIMNEKLSRAEQDALLTAGIPNAEEDFFRAKVKKIHPSYDIIFIPTSLYELYVATQHDKQIPIEQGGNPLTTAGRGSINVDNVIRSWDTNPPKSLKQAYKEVYGIFAAVNALFYPDVFMFINNGLAETLFNAMPELRRMDDATTLSNYLQALANNFAATLINGLGSMNYLSGPIKAEVPYKADSIATDSIIAKVIALEYEARAMNKGLLLRGSSPIKLAAEKEEKEQIDIIGSALSHRAGGMGGYVSYEPTTSTSVSSIATAYKTKSVGQHSVSLANSLFAGFVYDIGACAFSYLNKLGVGYGLFINKRYYYRNQFMGPAKSLDLFYIAPLCDLAAFLGQGGLFHSRTKVAKNKWDERILIDPFLVSPSTDPFGVVTTVRDPLINARLFSAYLAKNMAIIKKGDDSNLLPAERRVYEAQLKSAQAEAARQIGMIPKLQPVAARLAERARERIRQRKKEAAESKLTAADIQNRKQQMISRLTELRNRAKASTLNNDAELAQFALDLIKQQPYNSDTLSIALEALRGINGMAKIKYFGQTTDISFLLEPIIATINKDMKRLSS